MPGRSELYTRTFAIGFAYNFFMALNFTNNAIYPLYVRQMGGGAQMVGWFMGAAALAAVVGRPLIGYMIDRWGVKPVLLVGCLAQTLPSLGYWGLLSHGLDGWVWALRLVHGFGYGAHISAFFTFAAQSAPPRRRNESVAMYGFSGLAANLAGPFAGEWVYDHYGLPGFFLLVTLFGLIATGIILLLRSRARADVPATPTFRGALHLLGAKNLRLVYAIALLLWVCFSTAQYFLAPLAHERSIATFSLYYTFYAIAGMGIRLVGKGWGDRFGVRRILIPGMLLYGVAMLVIYLSHSTTGLALAGLLAGSAHGVSFPAVNVLGYNRAPTAYAGSVISFLTGMMDFGGVLTAVLSGQAAGLLGYGIVFPLAAAAGLLAALLMTASILLQPRACVSREVVVPRPFCSSDRRTMQRKSK